MDKSQIKNYDELKQKVDKINETILALEKEYNKNNLEDRMYQACQEKSSIQGEIEDAIIEVCGTDNWWSVVDEITESLGLEVESTHWMPSSVVC